MTKPIPFKEWWKAEGYEVLSALMLDRDIEYQDCVELGYNASQGEEKLREYLESLRRPEAPTTQLKLNLEPPPDRSDIRYDC